MYGGEKMRETKLYDVYDGETKIGEGMTSSEIQRMLSLSKGTRIRNYVERNVKIKGRYKITESSKKPETVYGGLFTAETILEWRTMNRKYGKTC